MELLDLPPEVFQRIIASYVTKVGLCEAWKHRLVCNTFAAYISEEVFGKQPLKVYNRVSSGRLLHNGLGRYLEYRSRALYDAHDYIPSRIRQTVDKILAAKGDYSVEKRASYTRAVSDAVAKYASMKHSLIIKPSASAIRNLAVDTEDSMLVCVAVAIEDMELLNMLAARNSPMWITTNLLDSPLSLAVRSQNKQLLDLVLQLSEPNAANDLLKGSQSTIFEGGLSAAMDNGHWESASDIMRWHFRHFGRPTDTICMNSFSRANKAGALDYIDVLLSMYYSPRLASHYRRKFLEDWGCYKKGNTALRILLEWEILSISEPAYRVRTSDQVVHYKSLLEYAMMRPGVDFEDVRFLLEAGADPNGIKDKKGDRSYPLSAVRISDLPEYCTIANEKVRLLLVHGADPKPEGALLHEKALSFFGWDVDFRIRFSNAVKKNKSEM